MRRLNHILRSGLVVGALGASACHGGTVVVQPTPVVDPEPAAVVAAGYTVAEWGVLVYDAAGAGELVSGPSPATPVVVPPKPPVPTKPPPHFNPVIHGPTVKKPVIYLRPDAAWDIATPITVTATMAGAGRLHEVWPTQANGAQPAHGTSFSWNVEGMRAGSCSAGWGPKVTDAPCASLSRPDACEAAEFEAWVPESMVCLDVGGVPAPALLYNGFPADLAAPISAVGAPLGSLKNVSPYPIGLVLVRNPGTGLVGVRAGVAPDEVFSTNDLTPASVDPVAAVVAELTRQGLTTAEAVDFMRAWAPLLQDSKGWTLFGFFGKAGIEAVSTLGFSPAPRSVTRVMAFAFVP